jgi:3D (Asp-Asp-Asp) domain-containing protein
MRLVTALVLLTCAAACGGDDDAARDGGAVDSGGGGDPIDASAADPGASLGAFQLTYYWVAYEADYAGAADTDLFDPDCGVLATVSADFADAIALEGTGRLIDGRLLNVAGACGCASSPCFAEADADHPWGYGVEDRALVPFRTVAVDADVIDYGTGLYIPALDDLTMPGDAPWGDFVHDGCVVAGDTGGAIVGMHIDFFVGIRDAYLTLDGELGLSEAEVRDGGERCADHPPAG